MKGIVSLILAGASLTSCFTSRVIDSHPFIGKCFSLRYETKYLKGNGDDSYGRKYAKLNGYDYFSTNFAEPKGKVIFNKAGCIFKITKIIYYTNAAGPWIYYELSSQNNLCGAEHVYHEDWADCLNQVDQFSSDEVLSRKFEPNEGCLVTQDARLVDCPK